jgi:D-alanyl-D-alanine carboxypeptidase
MKRIFFLCFILATLIQSVFAQKQVLRDNKHSFSLGQPDNEEVAQGLTLQLTLDSVFNSIVAKTTLKGVNAAILLPDGTYWKRAAGQAQELPTKASMTTNHLMGMGSITKTFSAVTLLRLVEDGLCSLDDSIGKFIGPYPNISGRITIRQVLGHRSGLNDYINENPASNIAWTTDPARQWTPDEVLNTFVLAPNFAPGTSWSYSNTNYILAGVLITKIAGQSWYQVVRQMVLNPLGLTHTFAYPYETFGNQPFAHVFTDFSGTGVVEDLQGNGISDKGLFSIANSAGCYITTPEDLARFTERIFGGHFLKPATLIEMLKDNVIDGSGSTYGLGVQSINAPLENWGHNGDLIYKAFALYFPREKISIAVQQNDDRYSDPSDSTAVAYDSGDIFNALLLTYLNFNKSVATNELSPNSASVIYPNPTSNTFQLLFEEMQAPVFPLPVKLIDPLGRVVLSQILHSEVEAIQCRNLTKGIYTVWSDHYVGKLVKMD